MKTWSSHWKSSVQPRKQRKYVYAAPLHIRNRFLSATLSKPLRKQHHLRSAPVRKGDKIKVMRGKFKGKEAEVVRVDSRHIRVFLNGLEVAKRDGSKKLVPVHPSNLMLTSLETGDKRRFESKHLIKK